MKRLVVVSLLVALSLLAASGPVLNLKLRTRVEAFKGSGEWQEVHFPLQLAARETALIICDMWDNHWCRGAAQRVVVLAKKAAPVLELARQRGILIIHAPSDTMGFYKDAPQRQAILSIPRAAAPAPLSVADAPLPIDDSDGGCDTPGDKPHKAWTRQHALIRVAPEDLVSDNGAEVYSALQQRGIHTLLVMGVHTNMCILNRTFAIKQMTKWGVRCILIRDLTDAMYDPQDRPQVSHEQGTELVIQHIEKYWAPTVLSSQLVEALQGK